MWTVRCSCLSQWHDGRSGAFPRSGDGRVPSSSTPAYGLDIHSLPGEPRSFDYKLQEFYGEDTPDTAEPLDIIFGRQVSFVGYPSISSPHRVAESSPITRYHIHVRYLLISLRGLCGRYGQCEHLGCWRRSRCPLAVRSQQAGCRMAPPWASSW